jgi:predicted nucleotidyltransferase
MLKRGPGGLTPVLKSKGKQMSAYRISREIVLDTIISTLNPLDYVHAMWEMGAASFGRVDEWSDIDLIVVVDDERVEDAFSEMEKVFEANPGFRLKYRLPEPTWHGHSQVFWLLKDASPFLMLDFVVMKRSAKDKFLQFRIHGKPVVHIDKSGIVKDDPVDAKDLLEQLKRRIERLKINFDLFQTLTTKELNRGNYIEAMGFFLAYTVRPLIGILRLKHYPYHQDFYFRYIHYELPKDVLERLQRFYFVSDPEHLRALRAEAEAWFRDELETIDWNDIKQKLTTQEIHQGKRQK